MALCFAIFDVDGKLKIIQECGDASPPEVRRQMMADNVAANGMASYEELQPETAKERVLEAIKTNPRMSEKSVIEVVENFIARHEQEQAKIEEARQARIKSEQAKKDAEAAAFLADLEELYGPDTVDEKLAEIEFGDEQAEVILAEIEAHRSAKRELEQQIRAMQEQQARERAEKAARAMELLKRDSDPAGG